MSLKKTWREKDTWNSTAFGLFRDTREWRYLLKLNPSFDIRFRPAPGTRIHVGGDAGGDTNPPKGSGKSGTLTQMGNTMLVGPDALSDATGGIYPWSSFRGYANRLGEYTAAALLNFDRINGYSLDSPQASSDTQRG